MDAPTHGRGVCRTYAIGATLASVLIVGGPATVDAQAKPSAARQLITAALDSTKRVRLAGNTRAEATAAHDRGLVPDAMPLAHLQLLLRRPPERAASLQRFIEEQHERGSPNFHQWLKAPDFAQQYGMAPQDVEIVSHWLRSRGFTVNSVAPDGLLIDFSGTAGNVREAFHTEIHVFEVGGERHIANASDPEIPAVLAAAVAGIVSLHDFRVHPLFRQRAQYTTTAGVTLVAPADLATIYNLNPLFARGTSGQSQTVVVIENTDVASTADWTTFRAAFGLAGYSSGSFAQVHPAPLNGPNNCTDPGVVAGNAFEAILDAEWASAAAPSAAIQLASCADTTTNFGGFIALQNLLNQSASPPAVISISYGQCEALNGAAFNAAISTLYEQAVAEGVSVFVAAGDQGAASCDYNAKTATHGIGVSGFASTAYNVAVGGTDFGDSYQGVTSSYWSASNGTTYGSAHSYVPEIPWDNSCASVLLSNYHGFAAPYGSGGFCNSAAGQSYLTDVAGSGGPSSCATGAPAVAEIVGGSCAGTRKPTWQAGVPGIPGDGVRDLPDVSLFAANGVWGHYYVVCFSDTAIAGGAACAGAPSSWSGGGGTSFAAPILAGVQALINQSTGSRQGNPNYVYYALAASQAASGLACNSSSGSAAASGCVFYDVSQGDMDVNCTGAVNCYLPSGVNGTLTTNSTTYSEAYAAAAGWDFATGIGSLNAYNLARYWSSSDLSLGVSGQTSANRTLTYTLTIGDLGPQAAAGVVVTTVAPTGVSLVAASSSSGCTQSGQTVTCTAGSIGVGAVANLTLVLQVTGSASSVSLAFSAASSNLDLDPANGSTSLALSLPGATTENTDVPLPPWAVGLLGISLLSLTSLKAGTAGRNRSSADPG